MVGGGFLLGGSAHASFIFLPFHCLLGGTPGIAENNILGGV